MKITKIYEEAKKSCIICNSCRYCEGLCAVFPAMEKKREFSFNDLDYLANLCHQCSECYYDCQYAPPHEFNVSIPKQFAALRQQSYEKYAFPSFLGWAFQRNAFLTSLVLVLCLFLGFWFANSSTDSLEANGNFFAIVSYEYMVSVFSIVSFLVVLALAGAVLKFSRSIGLSCFSLRVFLQSVKDVLTLKYLGGHKNEGCTYPNEKRSLMRKVYHHCTAYGFALCFIATTLGAIYHHFLGIVAPYDITQLPKIFGVLGGIMLCIGTLGLFVLKLISDKNLVDKESVGMDYAFIFMLFLVSFTGFVLMFLKESAYLAFVLWFHLSCVLAFFVMMPYSKFVHMFYRFIALLKYNTEEEN
ncbi:tricarballylate utilization 4Fe-4S protein TcuB [Campylobacter sp. MIT 21-1685]|uniref:tricarballylate utilization 4Fe-4S protein TcuB n=1 Tax=unclassified Campylobacter TaxID=2593542 RepID=UPI00224BA0F5|nr:MULTISPECIES: tricarballylate utilization 4Fe-4S protein TcuB [unclassified Campylobacter]MCX2683271.1 tricarballylate utilization 4Fe-4S protein TcuB [Campylobacter sp. MIT 21-1684]MCX2751536.1 tricarballylate utilization 4Fe-4S protein TcuB [Campylobacter sp. MIT 21-1682]MCX2807735.1 tricarballylate utilization 4Fe-4S protein TcuB [Campylobacter sp. MIT 21-1685]